MLIILLAGCDQNGSILGPSSAAARSGYPDLGAGSTTEVRGTWLNPYAFRDENARVKILDVILRARLNTVFVVAPSIEGNYGWSDENAFAAFVKMAHNARLTVHVWIGNMHRNQYAESQFTEVSEQKAQGEWALALMKKYNPWIDGIHLDFIRYSTWQDVNNGGKMDGVTATVKSIRDAVQNSYPGKMVTSTCFTTAPGFVDFEKEGVPQWYRDWFKSNPGNYYAKAYADFPTVPEHMKFQQNPIGWLKAGLVDGITPMQYTMNDWEWSQEVKLWKSFFQHNGIRANKLWMGLGWLTEENGRGWGYDVAGIVRKIKEGRKQGIGGFVIFELGRFGFDGDEQLVAALTQNSALNDNDAPFRM